MNPQHLSTSAEWFTPAEYSAAARELMGAIDLDPASCMLANVEVQAAKIYTKHDDGLAQVWRGRIFLNPPGSRDGSLPQAFWSKLVRCYDAGFVTEAVFIGFSINQLISLQGLDVVSPLAFPICVPRKRMVFENPADPTKTSPANGNFVSYLGPQVDRFLDIFERVGEVKR